MSPAHAIHFIIAHTAVAFKSVQRDSVYRDRSDLVRSKGTALLIIFTLLVPVIICPASYLWPSKVCSQVSFRLAEHT